MIDAQGNPIEPGDAVDDRFHEWMDAGMPLADPSSDEYAAGQQEAARLYGQALGELHRLTEAAAARLEQCEADRDRWRNRAISATALASDVLYARGWVHTGDASARDPWRLITSDAVVDEWRHRYQILADHGPASGGEQPYWPLEGSS